jgi:hypothetical protein
MRSKVLLNLCLILLTGSVALAQTLSPAVFSSLGSQPVVGNIYLSSTMGEAFPTKLTSAGNILTQGFRQPEIQINTGSVSGSTICPGKSFEVPYSAWGYVAASNIFTAQISDANGNFSVPVTVGKITGTGPGIITAMVPDALPAGNYYHVRVIGSSPVFYASEATGLLQNTDCSTALPIELLSFAATPDTNAVLTHWETAAEINNDYFTVEKSIDGFTFDVAGKIKGAGNSVSLNSYAFTDENPFPGISYYRLRQTDYNGRYSFSGIVPVSFTRPNTFAAYPNPAEDIVHVISGSQQGGEIVLQNMTGEVIYSSCIKTAVDQVVDLSNLASGVYMLSYMNSDGIRSQKIIKR